MTQILMEIYPIVQAECYGNGVYQLIRKCKGTLQMIIPERGKIRRCTKSSLLRLMAIMQSTEVRFKSMLTLTYPAIYPDDGEDVKKDISALLQKFRRMRLGEYLWFLEFQKRGAPHFHILTELDVITPKLRADIGLYWAGRIAQSDWLFNKHLEADDYIRHVNNAVKVATHDKSFELLRDADSAKKYAMSYASKERQKTVPKQFKNVGRFWGASDGVKPETVTIDTSEEEIRAFLLAAGYKVADFLDLPKYIW